MRKRMIQSVIIFILIGVFSFVILDFLKQTEKQKEFEIAISKEMTDKNGNPIKYGSEKGDLVYDYSMNDILTGEKIKVSQFRGKKILLNFWASWCPPCKKEAPVLQRFSEIQDDVIVLGVNVTSDEKIEGDEVKFIKEYGLTFSNVYVQKEIFNSFSVTGLPTSYIIDEDGIVEERLAGGITEDFLYKKFKKTSDISQWRRK